MNCKTDLVQKSVVKEIRIVMKHEFLVKIEKKNKAEPVVGIVAWIELVADMYVPENKDDTNIRTKVVQIVNRLCVGSIFS